MEVKRRSQRIAERNAEVEQLKQRFIEGIVAQLDYKRKYGGSDYIVVRLPDILCEKKALNTKDIHDTVRDNGFKMESCHLSYETGKVVIILEWPFPVENGGRPQWYEYVFVFFIFAVCFWWVYAATSEFVVLLAGHGYQSEVIRTFIILGFVVFYAGIADNQYKLGNRFRKFSMKV